MDLNRVAIFVRVVDERGFTAAARALHLPKSSVSRAVTLLEQELGVRLLQRSTRTVTLTEAGAAFYERASRGLVAIEDAGAAVADMEASLRGPIRITAPVDVGTWMIAPAVARFVRRHPSVHIDVVLTARLVNLVEEGFDLALRAGPLRDSSLIARKVGETISALYASPRYLARRGAPANVADLASHPCISFRPTRGRATWTLTGPAGPERVEVAGPVGADDFSFVRRVVLSGAGIGLLPSFACGRAVARGQLVRVLPEYYVPGAPIHVVYPSARYMPQRVARFRDFLVETIRRRMSSIDIAG